MEVYTNAIPSKLGKVMTKGVQLSVIFIAVGCFIVYIMSQYTYHSNRQSIIMDRLKTGHLKMNNSKVDKHNGGKDPEPSKLKRRKLPGFLIIGAQKCGTDALATFLSVHPQLFRTELKEIHFFSSKSLIKSLQSDQKAKEWYLDQMPEVSEGQITFEKTPNYLPRGNVTAMYEMNPDLKILVILCDPVRRAVSLYAMKKDGKNENRTFAEAITFKNGTIDIRTQYIARGFYAEQLKRIMEVFPIEKIKIIETLKLRFDPVITLKDIEKFLNISSFYSNDTFYYQDKLNTFCIRTEFLKNVGHSKAEDLLTKRDGCLAKTKLRTHPAVDEGILKQLRDVFRESNQQLAALTGINFLGDNDTIDTSKRILNKTSGISNKSTKH